MTAILYLCLRWGSAEALGAPATRKPSAEEAAWAGRWVIEIARPGWQPFLFTGTLDLVRDGGTWKAEVDFNQVRTQLPAVRVDVSDAAARLAFSDGTATIRVDLLRDGDLVGGRATWLDAAGKTNIPWCVVDGARSWDTFVTPGLDTPWPVAAPAEVGLDDAAVRALVAEAQRTHSGGFVLVKDGRLVVAVGEDPRANAHVASVSKALSSLAVPFLLAEGRWPSIDAPIGPALGAWTGDDPRAAITLRHVLSHTTGLETPDYSTWITTARTDHRADVLAAKLLQPPGTVHQYSNRAVELTSDLVAAVTGEALDAYLGPRLLQPLGIDATWWHDPLGHARVHAGVGIDAIDLAKVGVMMADGGRWNGAQVLPAGWVQTATGQAATAASARAGLGWFLLEDGRGFQHTGDSGAMLMVLPADGIVAARVHLPTRGEEDKRLKQHSLGGLMGMVSGLKGEGAR